MQVNVRSMLCANFSPKSTLSNIFLFNKYHIRVSTFWIQIQIKHFVSPDLDPNCLQRLSADNPIKQVKCNQHT